MFQSPISNLDKIRKARKKVKQLLLEIGLETCRSAYEEIDTYNPGDTHFSSTSWEDVSLWEAIGRRNGYRSKQYCCSLCKFSTKLLSSFKSHLQRYHEDEKDQELMSSCPSCSFTSQTKNVVKHMRIFHSSVRKVPASSTKESSNPGKAIRFSCGKCSFTDTLYYSMKRHVLMSHHQSELQNYFGEKSEEELKNASGLKLNQDKYYCKQCNCVTSTLDALIYHILTADRHRDLEQKLRSDISDMNRPQMKRPYHKRQVPPAAPSVPQTVLPNSTPVAPPLTPEVKVVSLPQNGPNQPLLAAPHTLVPNLIPSIPALSDPSGGLANKTTTTTVTPATQVGFVTSQNQRITLQASLPQSVFLSQRFPLNQTVTATVLPAGCSVGGQIISGPQTGVRPTVLPVNQTLAGGLLPINRPTVLACPQAIQANVINVNQSVRPGNFLVNQQLKPNNLAIGQTGVPQNSFVAAPILRQLIPTGKQVNGIPTYTLAPISVTLPVAPCGISAINQPKVPVQLTQSDKVVQISSNPASAPSTPSTPVAPVTQPAKSTPQKIQKLSITFTPGTTVAPDPLGKEAKQWKTCPVCNELFPSNVYEVHMQIAHIKQEANSSNLINTSTGKETKEVVVIAAQSSSLKVLKEKSIRCLACKTSAQEDEVLKHLLKHGMICLYCKAVFHELRNFIYHMKILHVGKKTVHGDFVKKGLTVSRDDNGDVLFPYFDYNFNVSREELGDKEMHLAVVTGANASTASTLYIKIQHASDSSSTVGQSSSKCNFCNCALTKSEAYETHLKERHHIMPTVHTILKTPAFKCIHCCGVYTGSMTLAAIAVHLQRCRNAPKDSISALHLPPEVNAVPKGQARAGMHDYAKPNVGLTADTQVALNEIKSGTNASKDLSPVPSKRRRIEIKPDPSELPADYSLDLLAMIPEASASASHDSKREFLFKYFQKKPYPSKKEIELLAIVLEMWRGDVASFFGTRRYVCMKFLKHNKYRVLLGFKMAELKKVKHDIELREDY